MSNTITTIEWTYGPEDWSAICAGCGRVILVGELALITEDAAGNYLWAVCSDDPLVTVQANDPAKADNDDIKARLEYLRGEIEAERISYSELADLQGLAEYIKPGDVVLLEWAGVPEFGDEEES